MRPSITRHTPASNWLYKGRNQHGNSQSQVFLFLIGARRWRVQHSCTKPVGLQPSLPRLRRAVRREGSSKKRTANPPSQWLPWPSYRLLKQGKTPVFWTNVRNVHHDRHAPLHSPSTWNARSGKPREPEWSSASTLGHHGQQNGQTIALWRKSCHLC